MKLREIKHPHILLLFTITTFSIAFISCRDHSKDKVTPTQISLVQLLVGDGTSQFRHVALGMDLKTVLGAEKKIPDEKDSNYLYYTLPMDTLYPDSVYEHADTLNNFQIAYNFDQQKLTDIDEDVFVATDSAAAALKLKLADYFTTKYGDGTVNGGSTIWKIKKMAGKTAKVSLSDESEEYDFGKLSLVYYLED
jgi:hypothetical protein